MSRNFQVQQIDHVEVFVPSRYEAAEWYEEALGLEVYPEYEEWAEDKQGPLMLSSDDGNTLLALVRGQPSRPDDPAGYYRTAFRVGGAELLEFVTRAAHLGISNVDGEPIDHDDIVDHEFSFSVYFDDPYGNRLEVTTYEYEVVEAELT